MNISRSINQQTIIDRRIQSNLALSLLEKNLRHLALSMDGCGVLYMVESFNNPHDGWLQSIRQGKRRIQKILELEEKDLTQSIPVDSTTNNDVTTHQVSIGFTMTPLDLKRKIKTNKNYPDIYAQENDKLNNLSTLLSIAAPVNSSLDNKVDR